MRYTLLMHYPEMTAEDLGPEMLAEGMAAFDRYTTALEAAGVLRSAEVLQPSAMSTTVSLASGELVVQDGPFADTKEQLGGTVVIDVRRPRRRARVGAPGTARAVRRGGGPPLGHPRGRRARGPPTSPTSDPTSRRPARRPSGRAPPPSTRRAPPTDGSSRCWRRPPATSSWPRTRSATPSSGRCAAGRPTASRTTRKDGCSPWPATACVTSWPPPSAATAPASTSGPTGDLDPAAGLDVEAVVERTRGRAGPAARAAARLRPPRHRPGGPHPPHAPDGARLRRRRGGPGLPRPTGGDGPAPGPGQAAHPDGRHPLPGAPARAARRAAARRDGGGVRRRRHRSRLPAAPSGRPDRRGAVAGRAAGLAAGDRARGVGARGAADAVVGPRGRTRPRSLRAAGGAGPRDVGPRARRRGRGAAASCRRAGRAAGTVPAGGGHLVGALRPGPHRASPTGAR